MIAKHIVLFDDYIPIIIFLITYIPIYICIFFRNMRAILKICLMAHDCQILKTSGHAFKIELRLMKDMTSSKRNNSL